MLGEIAFRLSDRVCAIVEYAGGECRAGVAFGQDGLQMLRIPGTAARDDGNANCIGDGSRDRYVVAILSSVRIHGRQNNLTRTESFDFFCPGNRF